MKKLLTTIVAVAAIAAFAPSTAQAQATGNVDISIDFPNILILYYQDDIDITLSGADIGVDPATQAIEDATQATATISGTTGDVSVDTGSAPTLGTAGTLTITLANTWASRSLVPSVAGGAGSVRLTVDSADNDFADANGDTVAVTRVELSTSNGGNASGADVSAGVAVDYQSQGLGTATTGDLEFDLDVSTLSSSGSYSKTFTLTLTAV